MDQRTVLVGTLSMTNLAGATRQPDVTHEMDLRAAMEITDVVFPLKQH